MSSEKNKTQSPKAKLLFSNVYQLPGTSKSVAPVATARPKRSSAVIKAEDLNRLRSSESFVAPEFLSAKDAKRVETKSLSVSQSHSTDLLNSSPDAALKSLKQNLKTLNDLQARMRFMLQEIEEFVIKS